MNRTIVAPAILSAIAWSACTMPDAVLDPNLGTAGVTNTDGGVADTSTDVSADGPFVGGDAAADVAAETMHDAGADADAAPDRGADALQDAPVDSPADDASIGASLQIQAIRDAIDAAGTSALPVSGAFVTYVRPLVGSDAAGFYIQAQRQGPAIFVAMDPAALSPSPVAGDRVSFTAAAYGTVSGVREVTSVQGYVRQSQGNSLSGLVQDLSSAADLVTALDSYESELVRLTGATITGDFTNGGTGFQGAPLDTSALVGNSFLRLRVATGLRTSLDLAVGCKVDLPGTPLGRFSATCEPTAWTATDLAAVDCPAPRIVRADATTVGSVRITFDRLVAPTSVNADGSQFTLTGGLSATSATVSGNTVMLATSSQTTGVIYTVSVAPTVTDTYGKALATVARTTTFEGYGIEARLLINEVNANLPIGADMVELRVVGAGNVRNVQLQQNITGPITLATLPDLTVAIGDLIVVHMAPDVSVTTETSSMAGCVAATCYPSAWDVAGGSSGVSFSSRVLRLVASDGTTTMDAIPFAKTGGASPAGFLSDLQILQSAGLWFPSDCGGVPCTDTSTPTAAGVAVDWTLMGATAAGISVQRHAAVNNFTASDWQQVASSWGTANP
jgi:hypothetical protein